MQDYFRQLGDVMSGLLKGDEVFTSTFQGEDSDFVRFNKAEVRQAGHVSQRGLSVDLIEGQRHAAGSLSLSGDLEQDRARIVRMFDSLREQRAVLPEDPHLLYATEVHSTEQVRRSELPEGPAVVAEIQDATRDRDLVGIWASGDSHVGFVNSLGQHNWYTTHTFNFDWSFYHSTDKAVKAGHAGFEWKPEEFRRKVDLAGEQLAVLAHPARTIDPGHYRAYLAPAALNDILDLVGWGSFGLKARRTRQTPLLRLFEGEARLNPAVSLVEDTVDGVAPAFQEAGFLKPDKVVLVDHGAPKDLLVSPRSAREFGIPSNGASSSEAPESLALEAGTLPTTGVLEELDTGLYIGNVWYLNWSDRSACRTTGMTRFGTFWVEDGQISAPVNVMRFDETLYRMLGDRLEGLTSDQEWILDPESYHARSLRSTRLPGALVSDFTLTL